MEFSGFSLCVTTMMMILGLRSDNALGGFVESKGLGKLPKNGGGLGNNNGGNANNGGFTRNYITWDDMKVDTSMLHKGPENTRNDPSGNRIIVVDQSGKGDSFTVQGAVDMVPYYNKQRVKIYIRPGIYRYVHAFS